MPDYIYLLENRLSADQQNALRQLREAAREAGFILFLIGDAVRDLTSGHAVRDLEVAVHGNALKLKKSIEKLGGTVWGESEQSKTLYLCFPGTVRVDVISTHRLDYTKIDKPVYHPASIQEDLRRRDFTVNAMAISLNEGSFGLLMDPLNGAADIEARTLRLVSNYGFLEEPSLLIRATRYMARLGWELDPKTQTRYENAKGEGVIERLSSEAQSRELEQIGHEDEGLKILRALEGEGWMQVLFPAWTAAKADEERLTALHDLSVQLLLQGVHADMSAAQMQLLTAKLAPKDLAALKKLLLRPGFVEEWNSLDAMAAKFAKVLLSKENSAASAGFKLFTSYDPEAVLWLGFTSKDKAVMERYNQFLKVWPEARQRIPHALMQEMRITPELAAYKDIVHAIFLELIDGKLSTPEEIRAFLEPHSPPAPPPQVTVKRPRAKRGEAKLKERSYDEDEESEELEEDEDLDDLGGDDDEIDLGISIPKADQEPDLGDDIESEPVEDEDTDGDGSEPEPAAAKRSAKGSGKGSGASGAEKNSPAGKEKHSSKTHAREMTQQAVPVAVSSKPAAPPVNKTTKPPVSRKEDQMAKTVKAAAPGVKPPQATTTTVDLTPGVKPPQAAAASAEELTPGVKPPQTEATAQTPVAKPSAISASFRAPGVKPPQAVKGRAVVAKPAAKKAPAKKAVAKAAPAKKAKPAPKPVKKAAKKAAPVKAAKKALPAKKAKPVAKKKKR
jgi:tRNA nucleotidyltransferase (CCA-adding enzyme)